VETIEVISDFLVDIDATGPLADRVPERQRAAARRGDDGKFVLVNQYSREIGELMVT
jgi:hypothetical protein